MEAEREKQRQQMEQYMQAAMEAEHEAISVQKQYQNFADAKIAAEEKSKEAEAALQREQKKSQLVAQVRTVRRVWLVWGGTGHSVAHRFARSSNMHDGLPDVSPTSSDDAVLCGAYHRVKESLSVPWLEHQVDHTFLQLYGQGARCSC